MNKTILQARQLLEMTTTEIADHLQIHRNTYGKWERGEQEAPAVAYTAINMLMYLRDNGLLEDWFKRRC